MNEQILSLILLAPLVGALLVALLPERGKLPAWIALLTTLATFGLILHLPAHFVLGQSGFQYEVNRIWIIYPEIHYHLGVDGLSLWLIVLTGLLGPVGVVASWKAIRQRGKLFYSLFLFQQTAMLGVFVSLDLMLYYGFWELSLIPMAVLIAYFGRKDGPKAALKFFLFTFIPSAPLLVAILWLYAQKGSFDYVALQGAIADGTLPYNSLCWAALAFLVAFAVKVPVFPLHGWLADVFSEAPVALSMIVAGKLGLYSMLRFHVGLFPAQAHACASTLVALAVIGILYGAALALVQRDLWKFAAYAAISHLSFATLGIYGFTETGLAGSVFQILNHGVTDGALLLLLGVFEVRYGSSQIASYGAVATKLPKTATFFVITGLSLIGLPMLNGFVSEFLILSGTFTGYSRSWAAVATLGVILSAAYMLSLVQKLFYGAQGELLAKTPNAKDLDFGEFATLSALVLLMLILGIAPNRVLPAIENGVAGYTARQVQQPAAQGMNSSAAHDAPNVEAKQ
jgi:NADH-quinone oxidoreductase subunit M